MACEDLEKSCKIVIMNIVERILDTILWIYFNTFNCYILFKHFFSRKNIIRYIQGEPELLLQKNMVDVGC